MCVRNSQLVGDSFDESEQICQQRVELRRAGGVNAPVGSRRELVANCVLTDDATQLASCVASTVCIGHYAFSLFPWGEIGTEQVFSLYMLAGTHASVQHGITCMRINKRSVFATTTESP